VADPEQSLTFGAFSVFSYESGSAAALLLANLVATKHYKRVNRTTDKLFNKQEKIVTIVYLQI